MVLAALFFFMPLQTDLESVEIRYGATVRDLTQQLSAEGIIDMPLLFEAYLRLSDKPIQAGEYPLKGETLASLAARLQAGQTHQRAFTIVEGWSVHQLYDALLEAQMYPVQPIIQWDSLFDNYAGTFLGETYFYEKNTPILELLRRSHVDLLSLTKALWTEGCHPALTSPKALITLASIVEKEAFDVEEMPAIANVLLNRLAKGQRLQVDPTVYFAVNKPYSEPLTREDLQYQSPYNTYTVQGLPPGPIAIVSRSALAAACSGNEEDYWYYVAKGDGTHQFSQTHQQHIQAVNQYIRGLPHDTQGKVVNDRGL
jgi:UPF0755 protein